MKLARYRLGISKAGLLAVLLVMLPNVAYLFITPPVDYLAGNEAAFWLWNLLENVGRFGLMASLTFLKNRAPGQRHHALLPAAAAALLGYYVLWALYFIGRAGGLSLIGMAVCPTLFFLLAALAQKNGVAAAFTVFFGVFHIAITASNFWAL